MQKNKGKRARDACAALVNGQNYPVFTPTDSRAVADVIEQRDELLKVLEECADELLRLGNMFSAKGQGYTVGGLLERKARAAIKMAKGE